MRARVAVLTRLNLRVPSAPWDDDLDQTHRETGPKPPNWRLGGSSTAEKAGETQWEHQLDQGLRTVAQSFKRRHLW